MATKDGILNIVEILKDRYPAYFKDDKYKQTFNFWFKEFKFTPDEDLTLAVRLHTKNSNYFPSTGDIADKLRRVDMIRDMNLATYKGRLKTYKEYKDATPKEVDEWVDTMRALHPEEAWTTKTFKDYTEDARNRVTEAWGELTDWQKERVEPWEP